MKGDRETCLAAGCTAFLTKPIKQDVLLRAIKEHSSKPLLSSRLEGRPPETISLSLTSKLADRAPVFLQNCRQNVIVIQQALERGDLQTVEFLGHGMRGSGGMFGFLEITEIGAALQEAAESADVTGARKWVSELSYCLDRSTTVTV